MDKKNIVNEMGEALSVNYWGTLRKKLTMYASFYNYSFPVKAITKLYREDNGKRSVESQLKS